MVKKIIAFSVIFLVTGIHCDTQNNDKAVHLGADEPTFEKNYIQVPLAADSNEDLKVLSWQDWYNYKLQENTQMYGLYACYNLYRYGVSYLNTDDWSAWAEYWKKWYNKGNEIQTTDAHAQYLTTLGTVRANLKNQLQSPNENGDESYFNIFESKKKKAEIEMQECIKKCTGSHDCSPCLDDFYNKYTSALRIFRDSTKAANDRALQLKIFISDYKYEISEYRKKTPSWEPELRAHRHDYLEYKKNKDQAANQRTSDETPKKLTD